MRLESAVSLAAASLIVLSFNAFPQRQVVRVGPDLGYPFSPAVKAGGLVFCAGTLATDSAGKIVAGDVRLQTKQVLENLAAVVNSAGTSMDNVVSANVYLRNAADFPPMNEVYRQFWPKDPPARTTVVSDLVLPEALVEISLIAVPPGTPRRVILPAGWAPPSSPYSYGVLAGDTLFLAGLLSRNPRDNSVIPGDMKLQTRTAMESAGEILKAAGMDYSDVASSRVYITDTTLFQDMNSAYRAFFPSDPPARATVRTGLTGPEYKVEITMTAVKGAQRRAFTTPNADGSPGTRNPNLSSAIQVGNRLYVSGMMGNTESNKGDTLLQTRETLVRLGRTLRAAGYDWGDVADGVVYVTDVKNFAAMNQAYREVFSKDFPARATVQTGLVAPDGLVEIMFVAVK